MTAYADLSPDNQRRLDAYRDRLARYMATRAKAEAGGWWGGRLVTFGRSMARQQRQLRARVERGRQLQDEWRRLSQNVSAEGSPSPES